MVTRKTLTVLALAGALVGTTAPSAQARGYSNAKLTKIVKHEAKVQRTQGARIKALRRGNKVLRHRVTVLEQQVAALSGNPPTNAQLQAQIDALKGDVGNVPNGHPLQDQINGTEQEVSDLQHQVACWGTAPFGRFDANGQGVGSPSFDNNGNPSSVGWLDWNPRVRNYPQNDPNYMLVVDFCNSSF